MNIYIYIYVYLIISHDFLENWGDGLTVLRSLIHKMLQFLGRQATREKQDNNPQNQNGIYQGKTHGF